MFLSPDEAAVHQRVECWPEFLPRVIFSFIGRVDEATVASGGEDSSWGVSR